MAAGALTLICLLGLVKDLYAVLKTSGRGQLVLGFLMIRYSSVERVWFGYRFTGTAAWLATFPHLVLYAVAIYGLIRLRRWVWYLLFAYVLYIPLSECTFAFLYPLGYLTDLILIRLHVFNDLCPARRAALSLNSSQLKSGLSPTGVLRQS